MNRKFSKYYLLSALIFFSVTVFSQVNVDSIFNQAISFSKEKKHGQALIQAKKALNDDKNRGDIMVFIANLYSWQDKNDTALVYIHKALAVNYQNDDLYNAWMNILLRAKKYDALLKTCTEAEQHHYSKEQNLFTKRMIAYTETENYDKGMELVKNPANQSLMEKVENRNLYGKMLLKKDTHQVDAYYSIDMFDHFNPQHLAFLDYGFHLGQNSWFFRLNYTHRFNIDNVQFESDFYLKFPKKRYLYLNYGFSPENLLFPQNRIGIEYYSSLFSKSEGSLGGRFMNYSTGNIFIATGHIGHYFGKNYADIRPFLTFKESNTFLSLVCNLRHYGNNERKYWNLELVYGNSPDDSYSAANFGTISHLIAYKAKIEKNFVINYTSELQFGLGYVWEEYVTNKYRNRYLMDVTYKFRF